MKKALFLIVLFAIVFTNSPYAIPLLRNEKVEC